MVTYLISFVIIVQVRISLSSVESIIRSLISEEVDWQRILTRFVVVNDGAMDTEDAQEEGTSSAQSTVNTTAPVVLHRTFRGSFSRPNPNFKADVQQIA